MGAHVEWADAKHVQVRAATEKGEVTDSFGSENDGTALVFGADSVYIVEGTPEELRAFAQRVLDAAARL